MTPIESVSILDRAVCLTLHCRRFGNARVVGVKDIVEAVGGDTETSLTDHQISAAIRLIDPRYLAPAISIQSKAKAFLRRTAIPSHRVFGEGTFLIPLPLVSEVDSTLEDYRRQLREANDTLVQQYEAAVAEQAAKLGPLFRREKYASPEDVAKAFDLVWHYVSFATPDRLETVDHALAMRAHEAYTLRLEEAYHETVAWMRSDALRICRQLAERLKPRPDGRAPVIRETALRDLVEYARLLPARNVVGDVELEKVVQDLAALADGVDPSYLRDNQYLREQLRQAADDAAKAIDALITSAPRRAVMVDA